MEFKYNSTVCDNLDDFPEIEEAVQEKVSDYQAYGTYLDLISTFAALYIGEFWFFTCGEACRSMDHNWPRLSSLLLESSQGSLYRPEKHGNIGN